MGIEGIGFIIGLIGAIWMKSSINLLRERMEQPELKMEREQSLPPTKVSPLVRAPVIPVE